MHVNGGIVKFLNNQLADVDASVDGHAFSAGFILS